MVENVKELLKLHEGITHEVYLDNENSSIVPKEVVDAMLPYFDKKAYGNPTLNPQARLGSLRSNNEQFPENQQVHGRKNPRRNHFHPKRNRSQQPSHNGLSVRT